MRAILLLLPLFLAGCSTGGREPSSGPGPIRERASGPVTLSGPTTRETQQCLGELRRDDVRYRTLPDRDFGSGCVVLGAVQLLDIGVPVTGITSMRCPLAQAFSSWVRFAVAPAAMQVLGSELVRIESFGTYSCRGIVGGGAASAARVSEHGLGNAVDVGGFVLRDGRRIRVDGGWNSDDPKVREFFRVIHRSACRRFKTVLGPDYNAAHRDHLHLDMGRGPFCR